MNKASFECKVEQQINVFKELPDLRPNNMHNVVLYISTFGPSAISKGHAK